MWLIRKVLKWKCVTLITFVASLIFSVELFLESRERVLLASTFRLTRSRLTLIQTAASREGQGTRANYSSVEADELVQMFQSNLSATSPFALNATESYSSFLERLHSLRPRGARLPDYVNYVGGNTTWEKFFIGINQYYLYDPYDGNVLKDLLKDLNTRKIVKAEEKTSGTQLKFRLTFDDGGIALLKPMRCSREHETPPDQYFFHDYERHTAEIAAFHLDMVLGFYRVPPTVGRVMNITEDILLPARADHKVVMSFKSPAGNLCIYGKCMQYCDAHHAACGRPDTLEGSIAAYLPVQSKRGKNKSRFPWRRTYIEEKKASWEENEDYCNQHVKTNEEYVNNSRLLLDVIDTAVLDFMIGNMDRHEFQYFDGFGGDTFLIHFDQGRGFGRTKYDCISCIAPLRQCCMIRLSTLAKLVKMYQGPDSLSQVMRTSLASDPLPPILTEPHLEALDRRLWKIIVTLRECMATQQLTWDEVAIDDGVL